VLRLQYCVCRSLVTLTFIYLDCYSLPNVCAFEFMHSKGRLIDPSVSMFVNQFVNKSMSCMNNTGIMDILSIEQSMHLQYGYMHNFLKDTFTIRM